MFEWFRKYVRKIGIFGVEVEFHPPTANVAPPEASSVTPVPVPSSPSTAAQPGLLAASNRFGIRGAAGYVVAQLDDHLRTEKELIQLAQERAKHGLQGTRYADDATVECPALRQLAADGRVVSQNGADGRRRYRLPPA